MSTAAAGAGAIRCFPKEQGGSKSDVTRLFGEWWPAVRTPGHTGSRKRRSKALHVSASQFAPAADAFEEEEGTKAGVTRLYGEWQVSSKAACFVRFSDSDSTCFHVPNAKYTRGCLVRGHISVLDK